MQFTESQIVSLTSGCLCGPGVVSGEAAHRVLSNHSLNFKSSQPQMASKKRAAPSQPTQPLKSQHKTPSSSQKTKKKAPPKSDKLKNPHKLLRKGLTPDWSDTRKADIADIYPTTSFPLT